MRQGSLPEDASCRKHGPKTSSRRHAHGTTRVAAVHRTKLNPCKVLAYREKSHGHIHQPPGEGAGCSSLEIGARNGGRGGGPIHIGGGAIHMGGMGATTMGTTKGGGGGKRGVDTQHGKIGTTGGRQMGICGPQYDPGAPNA